MSLLSMQELGQKMHAKGVREVIFVHGTFVGNDPLDIFNIPNAFDALCQADKEKLEASVIYSFIDKLKIRFGKSFESLVKDKIRKAIDVTLKDVGNYNPPYVSKFDNELGNGICENTELFEWGGGNSHIARLQGAMDLTVTLAKSIKDKSIQSNNRILLIGHSHAGQLFALLTIFLNGGNVADDLLEFIKRYQLRNHEEFIKNLDTIRQVALDFVTFGTPVRYKYAKYNNFRLLPVINHRSNSRLDLVAILSVENGDYVQQWGTEGTNLPNSSSCEKILSELLNNAGFDLSIALSNAARNAGNNPIGRAKVQYLDNSEVADNVLYDYGDERPTGNLDPFYCVKKVFGHGIYTTEEKMLSNTQLIVDHFYTN